MEAIVWPILDALTAWLLLPAFTAVVWTSALMVFFAPLIAMLMVLGVAIFGSEAKHPTR